MVKKTNTKKKYIPNSKEKYMCAKHKKFFTDELLNWKKDIIKANNLGNLLNSSVQIKKYQNLAWDNYSFDQKKISFLQDKMRREIFTKFNNSSE